MWILYVLAVIGGVAIFLGLVALILNIIAACDGSGHIGLRKFIDEEIDKGNIHIHEINEY